MSIPSYYQIWRSTVIETKWRFIMFFFLRIVDVHFFVRYSRGMKLTWKLHCVLIIVKTLNHMLGSLSPALLYFGFCSFFFYLKTSMSISVWRNLVKSKLQWNLRTCLFFLSFFFFFYLFLTIYSWASLRRNYKLTHGITKSTFYGISLEIKKVPVVRQSIRIEIVAMVFLRPFCISFLPKFD